MEGVIEVLELTSLDSFTDVYRLKMEIGYGAGWLWYGPAHRMFIGAVPGNWKQHGHD